MSVSNLTGCTWVGNSTIQYDSNFPAYYINYKAYYNSGANYDTGTSLYMDIFTRFTTYGLLGNGLSSFSGVIFPSCIYEGSETTTMTPTSTTGNTLEYIEFTGGTDATNANLIAWLEANGTLTAPEPEPVSSQNIKLGSNDIDKVYFGSSEVSKIYLGINVIYEAGTPVPVETGYLTFESDDGSEFTLGTDANGYGLITGYIFNSDGTFEYSTDAVNWQSWNPTTTLTSVNGKLYIRGSNNTYLVQYSSCFLSGTQITLADGTRKNVEDITYNDVLKVWNFDTGEYDTATICWLTKPKLKNYHYYKLTFSDGTILKTTGQKSNHKVYNVDERYFKGVNITEIGDRIFTENGIVTVVNKEYIEEEVLYYNLITSLRFGCFANGVLTSDRYGNIYPIDENMMFVKGDRQVRPYSEFEEAGISRYWYDNLRLGENTETVEETKKYIGRLESQMRERS